MIKINSIFNTPYQKKDTTLKNTAVAAGVGASVGSILGYSAQKSLIQNGAAFLDETLNSLNYRRVNKHINSDSTRELFQKIIDTKVISKKVILQAGIESAAIFSGIYLLGKGIKTLFLKTKKD